jgi:type I restriction enzyme, S subunit
MANTTVSKLAPDIPHDWQVKQVGEICRLVSGLHLDPEDYNRDQKGRAYFTGPTDYTNDLDRITKWTDHEAAVAKAGDVLITVKGSGVGSLFALELEEVSIGRQIMALRVKDTAVSGYLHYWLSQKEFLFKKLAMGNMIPGLTRSDILKHRIATPPLQEQKAIAHVLGLMDKAIETNNRIIAQKELRKKWLMQNLLTGKKRLEAFTSEWKEYHLGDFFTERIETDRSDLRLLSVGAAGVYPQSDSAKRDTSNEDKSKYKRIVTNDIGYNTMRMWQGRSALSHLEGIVSPAYTIVTPRKNADSLFFSYLFKTPKLMNLFWRNSQGLVDDTLNCRFKDFSIVKIHLPERDEQTVVAKLLQLADQEIQLLQAKTARLSEQKKGVMQQLLTGKKRLNLEREGI